jgi:radical SAM enzyme (TIGR01210 family)
MPASASIYPTTEIQRDQWIREQRPERRPVDPWRPYSFILEHECAANGEIVPVATIFLTNRECPWRCLMCDLWRNTLLSDTPAGAIPAQIDYALRHLPSTPRHIKLYNSGSFFDPRAIPISDYPEIADRLTSFERVIVECHPALIGENCLRFRDMLHHRLEVAMGLETVHPDILPKLNKRMTLPQFVDAAARLHGHGIDLRVFILVKPPFMRSEDVAHWTKRALDFAFDHRATAVTLIPTRAGNGAMDRLRKSSEFSPPTMAMLEDAASYGISLRRGRVFVDCWDLERLRACAACFEKRASRLEEMNLSQRVQPVIRCSDCGGSR